MTLQPGLAWLLSCSCNRLVAGHCLAASCEGASRGYHGHARPARLCLRTQQACARAREHSHSHTLSLHTHIHTHKRPHMSACPHTRTFTHMHKHMHSHEHARPFPQTGAGGLAGGGAWASPLLPGASWGLLHGPVVAWPPRGSPLGPPHSQGSSPPPFPHTPFSRCSSSAPSKCCATGVMLVFMSWTVGPPSPLALRPFGSWFWPRLCGLPRILHYFYLGHG